MASTFQSNELIGTFDGRDGKPVTVRMTASFFRKIQALVSSIDTMTQDAAITFASGGSRADASVAFSSVDASSRADAVFAVSQAGTSRNDAPRSQIGTSRNDAPRSQAGMPLNDVTVLQHA